MSLLSRIRQFVIELLSDPMSDAPIILPRQRCGGCPRCRWMWN